MRSASPSSMTLWSCLGALLALTRVAGGSAATSRPIDVERTPIVVSGIAPAVGDALQHRRLQNQREDCPTGIAHCDNPNSVIDDPTVACDQDTCAWLITLLDPLAKPQVCRGIQITGDVSDFLEPCLWWDVLYGGPAPTAGPSVSLAPSMAPSTPLPTVSPSTSPSQSVEPTESPSGVPSVTPSLAPSDLPSLTPSGGPTHPPTPTPSLVPSASVAPSFAPSPARSKQPSAGPSERGSVQPSAGPSNPLPTLEPTDAPSMSPSISQEPTSLNERDVIRGFETVLLNFYGSSSTSAAGGGLRRRYLQATALLDRNELAELTAMHLLEEMRQRFGPVYDEVRAVDLQLNPVQVVQLQDGTTVYTEAVTGKVQLAWTLGSLRQTVLNQIVQDAFSASAAERFVALLQTASNPNLAQTASVETGLPPSIPETAALAGADRDVGDEDPNDNDKDDDGLFSSDNLRWIAVIAAAGAVSIGVIVISLLLYRRRNQRLKDSVIIPDLKEDKTGSSADGSSPKSSGVGASGKNRHANVAYASQDDASLAENSHLGEQSAATSVYSYIDANLMDDHSYAASAAPYMYGTAMGSTDDQSLQSGNNWSVGYGSYAAGHTNGDELQPSYDKKDDAPASPNKMVVTTERRNKNDFFLFVDDDDDDLNDDLSMVSDMAKAPTRASNVSGEITDDEPSPLVDKLNPDDAKKTEALVDPRVWAFDDYMDSDEDADTKDIGQDKMEAPITSLRRLPLGDLSRVDESSKDASSSSSVGSSTAGSIEKTSALSMHGSKENLVNLADSGADSADDDSLFMENSLEPKGAATLALSSSNRLGEDSPSKMVSPMSGLRKYHDRETLNAQEKAELGVQSSQDEGDESLQLPSSYNVNEEKKDDISLSDAEMIKTTASF